MASLRTLVAVAGALAIGTSSPAVAAARWRWPVHGSVIQRFRVGPDRFAPGQHRGIDIAAPEGTPVRAACHGRVTFAGSVGVGGRTVSVRCGALTATYQHLSAIAVGRGQELAAGDRVGAAGRSGRARLALAHLHFGVHRTADRHAYVDPLSLLGGGEVRRPGPPLLGPSPRAPARRTPGSPKPAPLPVARGAEDAGVPGLAWLGAGLVVLALPGWGLHRRRRRAATRRPAPSASASRSA